MSGVISAVGTRPQSEKTVLVEPSIPLRRTTSSAASAAMTEPRATRAALIGIAVLFLGLFVVLPLVVVFVGALRTGFRIYLSSLRDPDALSALRLSMGVALIVVPLNLVLGVAAAWAVAKFEFRGKRILTTIIDIPFAVSPVIAGMAFMLLFGAQGWFGSWLAAHDIRIAFAVPGIVLATIFVTLPFIARELIPLMQEQGNEQEETAVVLGASGWQTFVRVTLPNIKWGLLYGVILCNARAIGEFGAVSVISGRIRGVTNTLPLHVEALYNEYNSAAAFAVASLLSLLAVLTLVLQKIVELHQSGERRSRKESVDGGQS
jgi:sulfate/thiosulfate transport system permease protein